ncbi:MAG: DoxX family protein [Acidobacteriota bacterium]|nr:DoxX family protein [Acidobacteriota bacterium]MDH3530983.1 DoxX family protein [Acidobacteriota bacterium]
MSKTINIVSWVFRIAIAAIFLQTLFFKFSGAEESINIFRKVAGTEMEPFARIGSGIGELIAAILIIIPKTRVYGAILSVFVISGAILSHLTILGIEVMDDGGLLFILACTVFVLSLAVIYIHRAEFPFVGNVSVDDPE